MKKFLRVAALLLFAALLAGCAPQEDPVTTFNHRDTDDPVKKGVCVSRYDDGSEESAARLNDLGIGWYYNWGAELPPENINAEYVPMVWGAGNGLSSSLLSRLRSGIAAGTFKHLLTFNEPDKDDPGVSSGDSVEAALNVWPQLEALNIPLSSPAPAAYEAGGWLDEFMEGAKERGYRVDFIALHCYQDFSDPDAPAALKRQLTEIYDKFSLPIWITEFAAIDISVWGGGHGKPACTEEAALRYTEEVTAMLEGLGFVERYAWFIDNTGSAQESRAAEAAFTYLYNNDDTLSATGDLYKAIGSVKPLTIDAALPNGKAGEKYEADLLAYGGTGEYEFSPYPESAETLPRGLTVDSSGRLYGTPSEAGVYRVGISATDERGQFTYRYFTLTVE